MKALYQRLKELDPDTFEKLCFQIWSEKLRGVELRHVEGKAGDKGTDLFRGVLANKPAIWQCKLFANGIKDAQKKQIKKSLKTALNNFNPSLWTPCIPVDLDINAHSWFQKLIHLHAAKVTIELFDASMVVKELIFRRPIQKAFFPEAVLDVGEIKAMLLGTGGYTDEQLGKVADETVDQYIERLREREPRYDYQVSYLSGNAGLAASEARSSPPNTVMSVQEGNRRLDLLVRDVEALRKDPPRLTLELSPEGAEKIQHALRSGSPVELGQGELMGFRSSFDFLRSPEQLKQPHALLLTPKFRTVLESFRVSFTSGPEHIVYDLIEFKISGKPQEIEFTSTSSHVPFHMHLTFELDGAALNFEAESSFLGHNILEIEKFFKTLRILRAGGKLELFDLKRQKSIGPFPIELTSVSEEREVFEELTGQLAEIARAFGQRLIAPEIVSKKDLETLAFLLEVSRHGEIVGGTATDLTAKLVRREESPDSVLGPLAGEFMIGLENENYPVQQLLGAQISVGPSRTIIEKASFIDFEEVKSRYEALSPGESMPVRFNSSGPIRQIFHRFYKGEPLALLVPV